MNDSEQDADWDVCYRQRSDVSTEEVVGETLVLDESGGQVHQLNQTASWIWRQCDGQTSAKRIVHLLMEKFDVDEAVAAQDVMQVIRQLCDLNLLSEETRS